MRINVLYKTVVILLVPCLLSAVTPKEVRHAAQYGALAKATIHVVDDSGFNVTNANVSVALFPRDSYANVNVLNYNTDTNGNVVIKGITVGDMNYTVTKKGYYKSKGKHIFYHRNLDKPIIKGKWQPWNPIIKVILREKKNPIPMYAKRVETEIPGTNKWYGYDFMVGDWVKPYGKGKTEDLLFDIAKRRVRNWKDFDGELHIAFLNKKDGIYKYNKKESFKSDFSWDYKAPTNGFINLLDIKVGYIPSGKGYYEENDTSKCYFRVRATTNELGNITSAYYGKMPTRIRFDVRDTKTGWLIFTYYLNSTPNDRNMEFDPKKNLFPEQQGKVDWP